MVIITYKSFHSGQGMPAPRSLFAANVVWSILSLVGMANIEFANVLGVGTLCGLLVTNSSVLGSAAQSVTTAQGAQSPAADQLGTTPRAQGGQTAP